MPDLVLNFAMTPYDRVMPLITGEVKPVGITLEYQGMPGGVPQAAVDYYVGLFKKVMGTPEWTAFMEQGAFNQTALAGKEYADWVAKEEARHRTLMQEAGFLASN